MPIRRHKFLWAQALDIPIVTPDYITASAAEGSFIETGPYEVVNCNYADAYGRELIQNGIAARNDGGLYNGMSIYVDRERSTPAKLNILPAKAEADMLIKALGGSVVTPRNLKALVSRKDLAIPNNLIIIVNEQLEPTKQEVKDAISLGGQRLTDREFLDSIKLGTFPKHISNPAGKDMSSNKSSQAQMPAKPPLGNASNLSPAQAPAEKRRSKPKRKSTMETNVSR